MRFVPVYDPHYEAKDHVIFIPEDDIRYARVTDEGHLMVTVYDGVSANGIPFSRSYECVVGGSCADCISRVKTSHGQTMSAIKTMEARKKTKEHDISFNKIL